MRRSSARARQSPPLEDLNRAEADSTVRLMPHRWRAF